MEHKNSPAVAETAGTTEMAAANAPDPIDFSSLMTPDDEPGNPAAHEQREIGRSKPDFHSARVESRDYKEMASTPHKKPLPFARRAADTVAHAEAATRPTPLEQLRSDSGLVEQAHDTAAQLAHNKFAADFVRGAVDRIEQGDFLTDPVQAYVDGFIINEESYLDQRFGLSGDPSAESHRDHVNFWQDTTTSILPAEYSTHSVEQISELERKALLTSIAAGAHYGDWQDLNQPPEPHFFLPIRQQGAELATFMADKAIDPTDSETYELSLYGFLNIAESIKFDQLADTDDEFAELNWYFDQFQYGATYRLEDVLSVIEAHKETSDQAFDDKITAFLQQRPEYIAYRTEKTEAIPSKLTEMAENAEYYSIEDFYKAFNVQILPDGSILSDDRPIGNVNQMGVLGAYTSEELAAKATQQQAQSSSQDSEHSEGHKAQSSANQLTEESQPQLPVDQLAGERLPRLTGADKTDRFIRFCAWIQQYVDPNLNCYITRVTSTTNWGNDLTTYAGVRFGIEDLGTNNIFFESLDDTFDAAYAARGRTGEDAEKLIEMLAHGSRMEVRERPDTAYFIHGGKDKLENPYNKLLAFVRNPYPSIQPDLVQSAFFGAEEQAQFEAA